MPFQNRTDAGRRLATMLAGLKGQDCIVLALPRGGVPVAAEVAAALQAPMDIILVRKIGVPNHPELAMGAVVDGGQPITIMNADVMKRWASSEIDFNKICARELREIERRRDIYLGDRLPLDPEGRTVIVVDDGIATGATMKAALHAVRLRHPRKLILAVPVGAPDTLAELRDEVDQIVCIERPQPFHAVGQFYEDFDQVGDAEVISLLRKNRGSTIQAHTS